MAKYTKKGMLEESLRIIKTENIVFISEIFAFTPFSRALFYQKELEKVDELIEAINHNKIVTKKALQKKWRDGSNAITQLALYKLIGTTDERKAISNAQVEIKGKVKVETFKVGYKDPNEEKPKEEES